MGVSGQKLTITPVSHSRSDHLSCTGSLQPQRVPGIPCLADPDHLDNHHLLLPCLDPALYDAHSPTK